MSPLTDQLPQQLHRGQCTQQIPGQERRVEHSLRGFWIDGIRCFHQYRI